MNKRTQRESVKLASRRMAACGMLAALSVTVMVLGSIFGVLVYAAPVLAGVFVLVIREEYGSRYAMTMFAAVAILALLLVPDKEMAAVYAGILGWYPILQPRLERLPRPIRWAVKLALFNGAAVAVYALLLALMGMAALDLGTGWELLLLLALANVVFVLYDRMLNLLAARGLGRLRRLLG